MIVFNEDEQNSGEDAIADAEPKKHKRKKKEAAPKMVRAIPNPSRGAAAVNIAGISVGAAGADVPADALEAVDAGGVPLLIEA